MQGVESRLQEVKPFLRENLPPNYLHCLGTKFCMTQESKPPYEATSHLSYLVYCPELNDNQGIYQLSLMYTYIRVLASVAPIYPYVLLANQNLPKSLWSLSTGIQTIRYAHKGNIVYL